MKVLMRGKVGWVLVMTLIFLGMTAVGTFAQQGKVTQVGNVTGFTPSNQANEGVQQTIDYKNAKPMPLPMATSAPDLAVKGAAGISLGTPGFKPGSRGDGATIPSTTADQGAQVQDADENGDATPQEYGSGTSSHPFTTSRVDLWNNNSVSKLYPYSAVGKLFFKIGGADYVCSASLIQPGVIVTAAHCVCEFGGGAGGWYSNWQFIPAYYNGKKPYGIWNIETAWVMTSYLNGTDSCYQSGVICANDVAVLLVHPTGKTGPKNKGYPGKRTGWLGYGWDGYGFAQPTAGPSANQTIALINQLGYPVSHDYGLMMQRTDSQGYVNTTYSSNTVWGSRQTGGSSGGPEIVNLGAAAVLSGTGYGSDAALNTVVGVTSWGWTDTTVKQQGASPFTSSNIVPLVSALCPSAIHTYACD
jgi:V8-like Glu-specific endopeptidase